jgi:hypothetical protein
LAVMEVYGRVSAAHDNIVPMCGQIVPRHHALLHDGTRKRAIQNASVPAQALQIISPAIPQ